MTPAAPFYCVGNWKLNKTPAEARAFAADLVSKAKPDEQTGLVVLPPALVAFEVAQAFAKTALGWGGQNCYAKDAGAFTGENSARVLKDMGAGYCLVGHSERRQIFGEPEDLLAAKTSALQAAGVIPILCVGETLDDRRWNRTEEVIVRQTRQGLASADPVKPVWLAYEPVWAIGTGQVATPEQVEGAHAILRKCLREWSTASADQIPILYGGSVKPDNAKALSSLANVNGFLIGGASLAVDDLLAIYRNSERTA